MSYNTREAAEKLTVAILKETSPITIMKILEFELEAAMRAGISLECDIQADAVQRISTRGEKV